MGEANSPTVCVTVPTDAPAEYNIGRIGNMDFIHWRRDTNTSATAVDDLLLGNNEFGPRIDISNSPAKTENVPGGKVFGQRLAALLSFAVAAVLGAASMRRGYAC